MKVKAKVKLILIKKKTREKKRLTTKDSHIVSGRNRMKKLAFQIWMSAFSGFACLIESRNKAVVSRSIHGGEICAMIRLHTFKLINNVLLLTKKRLIVKAEL